MQTACALCGVFITAEAPQQWMKEFRAIYVQDDCWEVVRLSGVGLCRENGTVAPCGYKKRYDDRVLGPGDKISIELSKLTLDHVSGPDQPGRRSRSSSVRSSGFYWGFGFHAACWDLLAACCKPSLRKLFLACLSTPIGDDGILDWGHTYHGAASHTAPKPFRLKSLTWDAPLVEGLQADPFHVPAIMDLIEGKITPMVDDALADHSCSLRLEDVGAGADDFYQLPTEFLENVVSLLPSQDVRALRIAAPSFALLELTEAFWQSRFNHEYQYILEALEANPDSWEALYFSIRTLEHGSTSLKNRKRIWDLALKMKVLLSEVARDPCEGPPACSFLEPFEPVDDNSWHKAARGVRTTSDPFYSGCRALRARAVTGNGPLSVRQLFVSLVQLGSGIFVSGLRFATKSRDDICIGYIHPDKEYALDFPPECEHESLYTIAGWYLALDLSGIRAVAALMDNGKLSSWAGDPQGFPRWRLAGEGVWREFSGVKAEFDGLKMVSLSRAVLEIGLYSDRTMVTSSLWSPDVPPSDLYYDGSQRFSFGDSFELPFSVVMFGGPKGVDLSDLVEIGIWLQGYDTITGFDFVYTDSSKNKPFGHIGRYSNGSTEIVYKHSGSHRHALAIDGPGLEVVKSLQVMQEEDSIHGLRVRTNTGRIVQFPSHYSRETTWTHVHPYGSTVVGFYAKCGAQLHNIGLISDNSINFDAALENRKLSLSLSHRRRKSRLSVSLGQLFKP
uniref:F-box domain-containing protein n=3 Tax=Bionectria ochroleuca TaxID=29856 RepID=A0A8H7N512_BIOOC